MVSRDTTSSLLFKKICGVVWFPWRRSHLLEDLLPVRRSDRLTGGISARLAARAASRSLRRLSDSSAGGRPRFVYASLWHGLLDSL